VQQASRITFPLRMRYINCNALRKSWQLPELEVDGTSGALAALLAPIRPALVIACLMQAIAPITTGHQQRTTRCYADNGRQRHVPPEATQQRALSSRANAAFAVAPRPSSSDCTRRTRTPPAAAVKVATAWSRSSNPHWETARPAPPNPCNTGFTSTSGTAYSSTHTLDLFLA
jgi:hypothetical protein